MPRAALHYFNCTFFPKWDWKLMYKLTLGQWITLSTLHEVLVQLKSDVKCGLGCEHTKFLPLIKSPMSVVLLWLALVLTHYSDWHKREATMGGSGYSSYRACFAPQKHREIHILDLSIHKCWVKLVLATGLQRMLREKKNQPSNCTWSKIKITWKKIATSSNSARNG